MKKTIVLLITLLLAFQSLSFASTIENVTYYVSPYGNGTGTFGDPFGKIQNAISAIASNYNPTTNYNVVLRGGTYNISDTIFLTSLNNIKLCSYANEKAVLTSYYSISKDELKPVTNKEILDKIPINARTNVTQANISTLPLESLSSNFKYGATNSSVCDLELFVNDMPQTIARWPNNSFAYTGEMISKIDPITFKFENERMINWVNASTMKLYGAWEYYWYWVTRTPKEINTSQQTITLNEKYSDSSGAYANREFFVYDLIEELDCAGEYYIDRTNKILYYYPLENMVDLKLTTKVSPFFNISACKNISFENIDFKIGSGNALEITNSDSTVIKNSNFTYFGQKAINATNVVNTQISNCEIAYNGFGGIYITGGDRITLTKSNNIIQNCKIHDTSRFADATTSCINFNGVGNKIINNKLYNMPHYAIGYGGNDNIISDNEIYNVCTMSSDAGALYTGRDWGIRGNVISKNYFHDISGIRGKGANCVYFDDMVSGNFVTDNVFAFCRSAVFIHGGRDNVVSNNMFYSCGSSVDVVNFSQMGTSQYFDPVSGTFFKKIADVKYDSEIWKTAYPQLYSMVKNELVYTDPKSEIGYPKNNKVTNSHIFNTSYPNYSNLAIPTITDSNNVMKQAVIYK